MKTKQTKSSYPISSTANIELQNKVNNWWDNLSKDRQWYLILNTIDDIRFYGDLPFKHQLLLFYKYKVEENRKEGGK